MLTNTLQSLVIAGKEALRATCGLSVLSENITQVRHGTLTFPSVGEIAFKGGTLQNLHLGCDDNLCRHLAENVAAAQGQGQGLGSALEILAQHLLESLLAEMPGRHPQGWLENLDAGPRDLPTRGARTFGFHFRTDVGHLYLMAEVPSRAEWELVKGSEFLPSMTKTYLPDGWDNRGRLDLTADIERFLIFLRKTELDVEVEVPAPDGTYTMLTGTLLESTLLNGRRTLRLVLDLSDLVGCSLNLGDRIFCRVGLKERALHFSCQYLGQGPYSIAGSAAVHTVYFSLPEFLKVEQRRLAFRIKLDEEIFAEIHSVRNEKQDPDQEIDRPRMVRGILADLSFSGARILAEKGKLLNNFEEGEQVTCRLRFPEETRPLEILGLIRRITIGVKKKGGQQIELGLEFLVTEHMDRSALEFVRHYVLSQQREWLAQRIHTAGATQW